jgi:hypothetical protein
VKQDNPVADGRAAVRIEAWARNVRTSGGLRYVALDCHRPVGAASPRTLCGQSSKVCAKERGSLRSGSFARQRAGGDSRRFIAFIIRVPS